MAILSGCHFQNLDCFLEVIFRKGSVKIGGRFENLLISFQNVASPRPSQVIKEQPLIISQLLLTSAKNSVRKERRIFISILDIN